MDGFATKSINDDTPDVKSPDAQFVQKPKNGLKGIFGKAAALASLAGTLMFYTFGFQIGEGYYKHYEDSKAGVTMTENYKEPTDNLPWLPAGGSLALAFGAGAAGIAAGRSRRKDLKEYYANNYSGGSSAYYNSYGYNDDWFFWYWMGRNSGGGGGGGSSGSWGGDSKDNGGLALALVVVAGVALAASASVVSYEALQKNFGEQGVKPPPSPDDKFKYGPKFS